MNAFDDDPDFDALKPPTRKEPLRSPQSDTRVQQPASGAKRPTVPIVAPKQAHQNASATKSINSERMSGMEGVGGVTTPVPQDKEAELAVLGALLLDRDAIVKVATFLKPSDFYRDTHAWVYDAILHLYTHREPPDPVTLGNELQKRGQLEQLGGYSFLVNLINATPSATHIVYYARIVQQKSIRRRLISRGGEIAAMGFDESIPDEELLSRASTKITEVASSEPAGFHSLADIMDDQFRTDEERAQREAAGELVGIYTGLADLDRWLGAMLAGDLIIPAARPGVGKSALAMCIARNVAKHQGKRVGVISLEMSRPQLLYRLYAVETGIEARRIRHGDLTDEEWSRLTDAQGRMAEWPIFINDTPSLSIADIASHSHRLMIEQGVDLLIVDYLQLVKGSRYSSNRVTEVGEVSAGLKVLARELEIPLIAPAQLSRESERRPNKTPILSDLRKSGNIENDADVVLLIHRPEMYEPTSANVNLAEIHIAKSRNGPRELVQLHFNPALTRFGGWAQEGRDYDQGYYRVAGTGNGHPEGGVAGDGGGGIGQQPGGAAADKQDEDEGHPVKLDFSQYDTD